MMKTYPSYKDSGVEWIGEIPSHWESLKVKNLFGFSKGKGLSKGSIEDDGNNECVLYGELFTRYKNLTSIEIIESKTNDKTDVISEGNELLIPGSTTTTGIDLSNCKFLPKNGVLLGGDIIILKSIQYGLNQIYYSHFLTNVSTPEFITGSRGVTIYHIYPKQIREIQTLLPPLPEQTQIVTFLDHKTQKIDELIEKTEQKIELLKEKRTSLINHCVTKGLNPNVEMKDSGVEWIGEIPSHWDSIKLKYIGFLYGGLSGKSGKDFNNDENPNNKPFIPFTNICDNTYISKNNLGMVSISEDDKQNRVEKNDLFFLMSSEDQEGIGKPSVLKDDLGEVYLNTFCRGFRITDEKYDSLFLNYLLSGHSYRELLSIEGRGFTRINLRSHKVSDFQIHYPPKETQSQIVEYLDEQTQKIDSIIKKETQRIELLKEYRQSLISEVVTGKIDVREWKE